MPANVSIRTASERDLSAVLSVYEVLRGPWPEPHPAMAKRIWSDLLNHPGTTVLLAELEGEIVGTATLHVLPNLTFTGSPYALVENVAVAKASQGQGIGRILMQTVIDKAGSSGCYKIMLLTGNQNGASEFYAKLGFDADEKTGMIIRYAPKRTVD